MSEKNVHVIVSDGHHLSDEIVQKSLALIGFWLNYRFMMRDPGDEDYITDLKKEVAELLEQCAPSLEGKTIFEIKHLFGQAIMNRLAIRESIDVETIQVGLATYEERRMPPAKDDAYKHHCGLCGRDRDLAPTARDAYCMECNN